MTSERHETTEPAPTRARGPRESRLLHDENGQLWRVREVSFADASPSLIFESEAGFRRVRAYPADWRQLGDDQLLALSWCR
jgi:hypothetical protein